MIEQQPMIISVLRWYLQEVSIAHVPYEFQFLKVYFLFHLPLNLHSPELDVKQPIDNRMLLQKPVQIFSFRVVASHHGWLSIRDIRAVIAELAANEKARAAYEHVGELLAALRTLKTLQAAQLRPVKSEGFLEELDQLGQRELLQALS